MKLFASYALAIGGLGMMLVIMAQALAKNLKYMHARLMLVNLLRTNPAQAERLCFTMPKTFFEPIGAAIKIAAAANTRDPAIITASTLPTFDGGCTIVGVHWNGLLMKAKMAGAAAAGGVLVGASGGFPPIPVILFAAIAVGCGIYLLVRKADVERSLRLARAEVLPEVDRAFIEGRYIKHG